jgi:hypothetical protein
MKDLGTAFSFFFKDPSWITKTLIAAAFMLLSLLGIGIPVLAGYHVQIAQRVMRREEYPLPPWSDIGVQFVLGFKYCVVYFVYMLPVILLFLPIIGFLAATAFTESPEAIGALFTVYLFAAMLVMIPYSLALSLSGPVILYRFAENERISEAIDIVRIFKSFKHNWQNTLVVAMITIGIQSFAAIGLFLFLIGIFLTIFYTSTVSAYLAGQLYLQRAPEEVQA